MEEKSTTIILAAIPIRATLTTMSIITTTTTLIITMKNIKESIDRSKMYSTEGLSCTHLCRFDTMYGLGCVKWNFLHEAPDRRREVR